MRAAAILYKNVETGLPTLRTQRPSKTKATQRHRPEQLPWRHIGPRWRRKPHTTRNVANMSCATTRHTTQEQHTTQHARAVYLGDVSRIDIFAWLIYYVACWSSVHAALVSACTEDKGLGRELLCNVTSLQEWSGGLINSKREIQNLRQNLTDVTKRCTVLVVLIAAAAAHACYFTRQFEHFLCEGDYSKC